MKHFVLDPVLFVTVMAGSLRAQWSTTTLSTPRTRLAAATIGTKAMFGGGLVGGSLSDRVDIYDDTTGTWSTGTLSAPRANFTATTVGSKVLFAGGAANSGVVDVYDDTTGTWSTMQLSIGRYGLASATVGTKAIFGGGLGNAGVTDVVDVYDDTTGTWSTTTLSVARAYLTATAVGSKVLFAGGWPLSNVVDIYDDTTGTWSTAALSVARYGVCSTAVGTKAIFAGGGLGHVSFTPLDTVDIFDDSTGAWSAAALSTQRGEIAATTVGDLAIFAGGTESCCTSDVVDIYDDSTGTWSTSNVSSPRWGPAATSVGNKALIGGGDHGPFDCPMPSDVVDIYTAWIGTNYCIATANSTGGASTISATGSESIAANDLVLSADNLPAQPGIFIAGPAPAQIPFFNGFLCVAPTGLQRFSLVANPVGGVATEAVDYATSAAGGLNVVAGSSYFYQRWNRDPAAGGGYADFSDGLEIVHTL